MATRKIKDAKDLATDELIYFKGHAKATYMSDGRTVEDAVNQIGTGGGGGGTQGPQGPEGPKGDDGVGIASVVQTTTSSEDGGSNVMTVTLSDGTTSTFTVKNGSKGSQGEKGDKGDTGAEGPQGVQGIQGIQGPKGDTGADGPQGPEGPQGIQGPKGDKGDKGDTGAAGTNGTDGVSVSSVKQTTTSTADGGTNVVAVTLSNGTTSTFNVKNGSKGSNGTNGTNGKDGADGEDGATFTPSVDANGNLSWTNNKGLSNPPTVNIKGPKGDSGEGGGSGEDIRYFTEFTVHEFITACENEGSIRSSGLYDAIMNNKIICIPEYRGGLGGFIAASSYTYSDITELHVFECILEYGQVTYEASLETEQIDADSLYGMFPISKAHRVIFCDDFVDYIEDNVTYIISNEVNSLMVNFYGGAGSTVRFQTGDNPVLEMLDTTLWPNGVMPEIEPNTYYELSLASSYNGSILAVLTPFKSVE